jgi:hypothetical protein
MLSQNSLKLAAILVCICLSLSCASNSGLCDLFGHFFIKLIHNCAHFLDLGHLEYDNAYGTRGRVGWALPTTGLRTFFSI